MSSEKTYDNFSELLTRFCHCERSEAISIILEEIATLISFARDDRCVKKSEKLQFMTSSILITGGNKDSRFKKAVSLFSDTINSQDHLSVNNIINNPDIQIVSPKISIGIDQIRQIQKNISLKPVLSNFKTVIIEEAHLLTLEAQNALLKMLEEPPSYQSFFLLSPNPDLLLPTVISRCQIMELPLENPFQGDFQKKYSQLLENLLISPKGKRLDLIGELIKNKEEALNFLHFSLIYFRPLLNQKEINLSHQEIVNILKSLQKTIELLEKNINVKLAVDNLLLSWPISKLSQ